MPRRIRIGFGAKAYALDAHVVSGFAQPNSATLSRTGIGGLVHGQPLTITGAGFGTKTRGVAPVGRDIGSAPTGTADQTWNAGVLPNSSSIDQNFVLKNRDVGFSFSGAPIGAPHPYTPRIIAAASTGGSGSDNARGSIIGMGIQFDRSAVGADYVLFCSIYRRADPGWTPDVGSPNDNNFKTYALNETYDPFYHGVQFGYLNYNDQLFAWTPNTSYVIFDKRINAGNAYTCAHGGTSAGSGGPTTTGNGIVDGTATWNFLGAGTFPSRTLVLMGASGTAGFASPDANGNGLFRGQSLWPMYAPNGWIKDEIVLYGTASGTLGGGGRIDVFENCDRTNNICGYRGYTDQYPAATTNRSWLVGGYNRDYGPSAINNGRYFADGYFDIEWGVSPGDNVPCAFVGNNPVFGAAGSIHEPQVADSWADGSVHIPAFWKGRLPGGVTGYQFIQPRTGAIISAGSALISASP